MKTNYFYLLDTNILSDFIKHPTGRIFAKIQEIGEEKKSRKLAHLNRRPYINPLGIYRYSHQILVEIEFN